MAITKRHYYATRHSPHRAFEIFFWPLLDLMLWGLLSIFLARQHAKLPAPAGFLVGGVLIWDLLFRSKVGIATAFLEETWSRNVVPLLASPVSPAEYLAGSMLWAVAKLGVGWVVMTVLARWLFGFSIFSLGPALVLLALAAVLFGVALSMFVIGLVMRYGHGTEILAWGMAAMIMPLAAVFYPLHVLPGWARVLAGAMPPAHVFEAMRALLVHAPLPRGHVVAAFALDAVYLAAGAAYARAMFRSLRRLGLVTRYM
jgi:ABC-2 type transport system permease protein